MDRSTLIVRCKARLSKRICLPGAECAGRAHYHPATRGSQACGASRDRSTIGVLAPHAARFMEQSGTANLAREVTLCWAIRESREFGVDLRGRMGFKRPRRGGRVVEGTPLLRAQMVKNRLEGSNPFFSAIPPPR